MRGIVVIAGCVLARIAHADPQLEASGFVGLDYFGTNSQLGNSWAPEQIPGTAPTVGARVLGIVVPDLNALGPVRLALGVEGEIAIATAYTGGSYDGGRMAYFAPVFSWRGHAVLRGDGLGIVHPHLIAGLGGQTVASESPFMVKETDPEVYWGLGASVTVSERWRLRVDARHGIMPGRDGVSSSIEIQLGIGATFGLPRGRMVEHATVVAAQPQPVPSTVDRDGDGIPDWLDACPTAAETVNGIDDDDGCPEEDPDGDGIVSAIDRCPDVAEDFDHFEDDDGCPEPDNDRDGLPDARDACPDEPETRNGFDDTDGCPDTIPPAVTQAIAAARAIRFEPGRARVTPEGKRALAELVSVLVEHDTVRVAITVHADRAGAGDLARRRAEAIKWYLVDQGPIADHITTTEAPVARGDLVELVLVGSAAPGQ